MATLGQRTYELLTRMRPAPVAVALKKVLRIKRHIVETKIGRFCVDPASAFGVILAQHGEYEPQMSRTLERILCTGSTFIDIGANEGYFTVLGSKIVGVGGKVIAVEPQQRLKAILFENFKLNNLSNVSLIQSAISDNSGRAVLNLSADTNTGASGFVRATKYKLPTEMTETITLSELFSRIEVGRADLIKMDIEGAEYDAILGSPQIFRDHRVRAIALEVHVSILEKRGVKAEKIFSFLKGYGYTVDNSFSTLVYVAPTCSSAAWD
ncbi:MAG TPA: FkbM family methyltransferase [Pyrinomonadaceae bacterium]|nr:FkbM family methyltransferase [Pyrinomonadaceae bacterium]